MAPHAAQVLDRHEVEHNGTIVKRPMFYEDYVGPQPPSWTP
jgi:hypothetical protein